MCLSLQTADVFPVVVKCVWDSPVGSTKELSWPLVCLVSSVFCQSTAMFVFFISFSIGRCPSCLQNYSFRILLGHQIRRIFLRHLLINTLQFLLQLIPWSISKFLHHTKVGPFGNFSKGFCVSELTQYILTYKLSNMSVGRSERGCCAWLPQMERWNPVNSIPQWSNSVILLNRPRTITRETQIEKLSRYYSDYIVVIICLFTYKNKRDNMQSR